MLGEEKTPEDRKQIQTKKPQQMLKFSDTNQVIEVIYMGLHGYMYLSWKFCKKL